MADRALKRPRDGRRDLQLVPTTRNRSRRVSRVLVGRLHLFVCSLGSECRSHVARSDGGRVVTILQTFLVGLRELRSFLGNSNKVRFITVIILALGYF